MLRNRLSPKLFVVIFLTLLATSFSYAEGENKSNPLADTSDFIICASITDLAVPEQRMLDEATKRGLKKGPNCAEKVTPPLIKSPIEYPISPAPEKVPKSYLYPLIMIAVFLFILFNVAFKIIFRPKFTIKLRPFPSKKASKPLTSQNRPEVKAHSSDFESHLSNQTETIKSLRNDMSTLLKTINDMNQTFMTLKTNLDQKDEEISRFKDGYDATIFKNFLLRFTRVDKVIKEYLGDNKIDINGLKDIQIQMDDALAECDVEVFSPKIGANFKSAIGVADNPEIRDTSDKLLDSTIAEILMPGYHRKLPSNANDDYQIIIEAKVVIYVHTQT